MDLNDKELSSQRKDDHISLAENSQLKTASKDPRFYYEPLLSAHPNNHDDALRTTIFSKTLSAPLWVSSMTGGSDKAYGLNRVIANTVKKFKIGMGLGSCRCLMHDSDRFEDFNLRPIIGDDLPFFANIGIAQLEELNSSNKVREFFLGQLSDLGVDGLIIHVNPLQEWLQPEGDRLNFSPILSIETFLDYSPQTKIIVKEVGQGFGPSSMKQVLELPIEGIEFAAFGGTNFSRLETLRHERPSHQKELAFVGHSVEEMIGFYNSVKDYHKDVIISGGINNFLDGYYYKNLCHGNSVIGMAGEVLKYALNGQEKLDEFIFQQIEGLRFATSFLTIKKEMNK